MMTTYVFTVPWSSDNICTGVFISENSNCLLLGYSIRYSKYLIWYPMVRYLSGFVVHPKLNFIKQV